MSHLTEVFAVIASALMLLGNNGVAQHVAQNDDTPPAMSAAGGLGPRAPAMQSSTKPVAPPPSAAAAASPPEMLIDSGDLLEVSVYGASDFDKVVRVSGTGDIVLPLINVQHVGGLTAAQAEELIARKLVAGQFFNDPQVSIFVKDYVTQGISVLGEVQKPGVYPLLGSGRRLFDAISMAGGLTPKAGKVVTVTHRGSQGNPEKVTLDNKVQDSSKANVEILPGDTILISKAGIVYVVGDVRVPGGFIMENGSMTVLQALAMAQGANNTAALDSAKLIRTLNGKQQEVPIPLKPILASKAPDLKLQAEDIVFVPNSAGKSAVRRGLEAILQTATGVAIYRP